MKIIPGEFVTITERKCSENMQPHIKLGGVYCVSSLDQLKDGTPVLILVRDSKKKIDVRINAKRFSWKKISKEEVLVINKKEYDKQLFLNRLKLYDINEQRIVFVYPHFVQALAFKYAEYADDYCAKNKLSEFRKVSRELKELIVTRKKNLLKNLSLIQYNNLCKQVDDFENKYKMHFIQMFYTLQNELQKQNKGLEYSALRTYAFIVYCFCCEVAKFEDDRKLLIEEREGYIDVNFVPNTDELYLTIGKYLGDTKCVNTDLISLCFRVFEKNLKESKINLL